MKAYLLYTIMSSAIAQIHPPSNVDVTDSKIQKVTVFLAGAQVQRDGTCMLPTGTSEVIFSNVSADVDPNTLQARGIGDFTIMDVKFDILYPQPEKIESDPNKIPADVLKKMRLLGDSIDVVTYQLEELRAKKEVRTLERQMLLNNGTVKGVGKVNDSIQLLKSAMEYFHVKMTEINLDLMQLKKKEDDLNKKLTGMNHRLDELQNWSDRNKLKAEPVKGPIHRIIVSVNADKPVRGKIEISYLVNRAGWVPQYDIRATNVTMPVELNYKAQVYQNTGEDWERVPLTLSSNNPYIRQQKPEMVAWYINGYYINEPYLQQKAGSYVDAMNNEMQSRARTPMNNSLDDMQKKLEAEKPASLAHDFTTKTQSMISAEFEIKLPYTIKSNNQPHLVAIDKKELKANYYMALVPKLDKNAFLVANITNWDDLDLLPAKASIYYDGTYVGQSYIDPSSMEDTLKLALGRDNNISAIRKKLKDKTKERFTSDNKINEIAYEINIRNAHAYAVDVIVEDQIPVSNVNDIKVEVIDIGKAQLNQYNGFLKWRMKLKGPDSEKITFSYQLKYDKNKQLSMTW